MYKVKTQWSLRGCVDKESKTCLNLVQGWLGSTTSVPAKLKIFSVHKTTHIPHHTMFLLCLSFVFFSSQFYLPKTVGADCTWACHSSLPWPRWLENSTRRWRQDGRRGSMWERLPPPVLRKRERERGTVISWQAFCLFIGPSCSLASSFSHRAAYLSNTPVANKQWLYSVGMQTLSLPVSCCLYFCLAVLCTSFRIRDATLFSLRKTWESYSLKKFSGFRIF